MRGRSKAERLERAIHEAHNRFRRPLQSERVSRSFTGRMRHDVAVVGSAEAETAWRERPPRWPQARSQTGSDLVVAHATAALCVAAQGSVAPTVWPKAPLGILRSEITDLAGIAALKRCRTCLWESAIQIGREDSRRGNTPRDALFPPSFPYQLRRRRARSRDWSTDEAMSRQTRATLARYCDTCQIGRRTCRTLERATAWPSANCIESFEVAHQSGQLSQLAHPLRVTRRRRFAVRIRDQAAWLHRPNLDGRTIQRLLWLPRSAPPSPRSVVALFRGGTAGQ